MQLLKRNDDKNCIVRTVLKLIRTIKSFNRQKGFLRYKNHTLPAPAKNEGLRNIRLKRHLILFDLSSDCSFSIIKASYRPLLRPLTARI